MVYNRAQSTAWTNSDSFHYCARHSSAFRTVTVEWKHTASHLFDGQVRSVLWVLSKISAMRQLGRPWESVLSTGAKCSWTCAPHLPYRPVSVQFPRQRTAASVRPPELDRSKTATGDAEALATAGHTPQWMFRYLSIYLGVFFFFAYNILWQLNCMKPDMGYELFILIDP